MEFDCFSVHLPEMAKRGEKEGAALDQERKNLLEAAKAVGLDLAPLSKRLNRNHAYLGQYVWRTIPRRLDEVDRKKLAEILEIDEDLLKPGAIPLSESVAASNTQRAIVDEKVSGLQFQVGEQSELRPAGNVAPVLTDQDDLPVYGYVAGVGEDEVFFIDQGHEMTRTVRPNILKNAKDAYAVDVYGDSMSPRFEPGNRLWVYPKRPTKSGEDVVIQLVGDRAIVKRLVRKTEKFIIVKQFNPVKELKIPKDQVQQIDLVVGVLLVAT